MNRRILLFIGCSFFHWSCAAASLAESQVDYLQQVKPILTDRCYACHGALKHEGGLRLDSAALVVKGGDSGAAIRPGNAAESLLIQRITASDPAERMPAEGEPLKPEQIAALLSWIDQGANAPANEQSEPDPHDHWAFRPIARPPVPVVTNSNWVRNPIDSFVAEKHEQLGLRPQTEAPREVLLRRLHFDLVGLPPSEEDLAQLDADSTGGWYERCVDKLLDDPRHGERWARHWMDIWRYSDWWGLGDQLRNSQPHIWHWRDWIVESLNSNVPYDEMVRLMLAADELHPNDLNKLRATGFLARNYFVFNRNQWMEETVEHVSKGFLALTINCAKCHDHKYDPISQVDFYRMRAFFEPYHVRIDAVPGEPDLARNGIPCVFDGWPDSPTYRFERGQESHPDKSTCISPGVPSVLAFDRLAIQPVSLPVEAREPDRRPWVLESYVAAAQKQVVEADAALAAAKQSLQRLSDSSPVAVADAQASLRVAELQAAAARAELRSVECRAAATRAVWANTDDRTHDAQLDERERAAAAEAVQAECQAAVTNTAHLVAELEFKSSSASGDSKASLEKELAAAKESLAKAEKLATSTMSPGDQFSRFTGAKWTPTRFLSSERDDPQVNFPAYSTGRRTALAAWIADRRNPLTARVAVNHIWARHVGTPLVATMFDFGRKATPPSHPELLDWLASELIDSGWDMKHLHRLIVMSSTYRMSSSTAGMAANIVKDADNLGLWRRAPVRLEAQAVRDSLLSLAGTLDCSLGGPSILPSAQDESTRRSIYFFHSNNDRNRFLTTFDDAPVNECYRRDQSIVPQQALALSNSRLVHDAAGKIAERLSSGGAHESDQGSDRRFIERAFYVVLGIRANEDEIRASLEALNEWREQPLPDHDRAADPAQVNLVWALLNHSDFVTVR
jgi:hypothetical protein